MARYGKRPAINASPNAEPTGPELVKTRVGQAKWRVNMWFPLSLEEEQLLKGVAADEGISPRHWLRLAMKGRLIERGYGDVMPGSLERLTGNP